MNGYNFPDLCGKSSIWLAKKIGLLHHGSRTGSHPAGLIRDGVVGGGSR